MNSLAMYPSDRDMMKNFRDKTEEILNALEKAEESTKAELKNVAKNLLHEKAMNEVKQNDIISFVSSLPGQIITDFSLVDDATKEDIQHQMELSQDRRERERILFWNNLKCRENEIESLNANALYRLIIRLSSNEPVAKMIETSWK